MYGQYSRFLLRPVRKRRSELGYAHAGRVRRFDRLRPGLRRPNRIRCERWSHVLAATKPGRPGPRCARDSLPSIYRADKRQRTVRRVGRPRHPSGASKCPDLSAHALTNARSKSVQLRPRKCRLEPALPDQCARARSSGGFWCKLERLGFRR